MKFSVLFIYPLVIAPAMVMMVDFMNCDLEEWVITNTTLKWENQTKMIESTIYKQGNNNIGPIKIYIEIGGCKNHTNCKGTPKVSLEKTDCAVLGSSEPCRVANNIADMEREEEWITNQYGQSTNELYNQVLCY